MSFSKEVKEELLKQMSKSRHCQLAELAAILEFDGVISTKPASVRLSSDNPLLVQKFALLMRMAFSIDVSKELSEEDARSVLDAIKWDMRNEGGGANELLLQKTCCKRAYLRGAFLAVGSMNDPNKSYHFEIVCRTMAQATQVQNLMQLFELDAKIVERKGHMVVYLKEGAQIVDMLNVMEAYVSLMNLENVRILKDMRNQINRGVNCEAANIQKTVNAARKQLADIELIRDTIGFDDLPPHLKEIAMARLENPDTPLKELGTLLDPPVGKSGVNHRLRKLSEIAATIETY